MKNWYKHIIFFPIFFFLMYMGPRIMIGPVKFIVVWKLVIILVLMVLLIFKGKKINLFIKLGYLYAFKIWLSIGSFMYVMDTISSFTKFLILPLVAHFTLNYLNYKNLYKFLNFIKSISIYILLSSIPFLLGLLEPNTEGYDLSSYGIDSYGFAGIFQNEHSASVNIAISIIVISFFFFNFNKFKYLIFIIFGIYLEYKTYVRTGYLAIITAMYFMAFKGRPFKTKVSVIFVFIVFSFVALSVFKTDKALQMRLEDKTVYREETTEDNLGSGRLMFARTNIENLFESNGFGVLFGLGREYSKDLMEDKIGHHLVSHNGYIDALTHNGIIGFTLFILMLYNAYRIIINNKQSIFYNLTYSIFIAFIFVTLTQSYGFFYLNMFLSMLIIIQSQKNIINEK